MESEGGGTAELDVALAHPWSQDVLPSSANTDGAAARRREEIKHKKYSHETLPGGYSPSLIHLVMEQGQEASDYLNQLSRLSRDEDGRPNPSDFKTHWRCQLSVQCKDVMPERLQGRRLEQRLDDSLFRDLTLPNF